MIKTQAKFKNKSALAKGVNYNVGNLRAGMENQNEAVREGLHELKKTVKAGSEKLKETLDQTYEKKLEAKKHGMWGNFFESSFNEDLKNSINNFVNLVNNSIYGVMHTNNDCTKQTQNMLSKISTGVSNTIEKNMEHSGNFLKCQTAIDMIELQQKFFEMNFANIINLYSDVGHCYQAMTTSCCENASVCAEKSVKCFVR